MKFKKVSVVIPTLRETEEFLKTVDVILDGCESDDLKEFIIVVCKATTEQALEYVQKGAERAAAAGVAYHVLYQTRPFLGGALMDGFDAAAGSHVAIETADLNTAPENLGKMIELAKRYPDDVISCSRWLKGSAFENYSPIKKAWNYCSQKFLQLLYLTNVTDFTWGTHLAPTALYQSIRFTEAKHPIAVEEVVIPLRLGVRFHEIPGTCHVDVNDVSVQPLWANLLYLRPAFKWRFAARKNMLLEKQDI